MGDIHGDQGVCGTDIHRDLSHHIQAAGFADGVFGDVQGVVLAGISCHVLDHVSGAINGGIHLFASVILDDDILFRVLGCDRVFERVHNQVFRSITNGVCSQILAAILSIDGSCVQDSAIALTAYIR